MCVLKMLDFVRCSRRLCGGEDVTFCCDRKVPKSAQRGLKSERAGISAPSGLPPPLMFIEGKSGGWLPGLTLLPRSLFFRRNVGWLLF